MGKPSIFSREYQKKMKRRRRNIIIISLAIILVTCGVVIKVVYYPIDFTNVRNNIQAWIDSDDSSVLEKNETEKNVETEDESTNKEAVKEDIQKPLEEYINVTLKSGSNAKAVYINDGNNGKVFKTLDTSDKGVNFNISPSGKQMIVTDTNCVITLYNVDDGSNKVVSKDQYISTSGNIFTKEDTLKAQPEYLWNSTPKFINEDIMLFVTNRPYFGISATKQYLWLTNIKTNEDKVLWSLAGENIQIGEREEKGIKVTVDGMIFYVDANGNYVQ